MKKLLFYAAALLAAITFSACSDDDKEPTLPVTPENIAGTWQLTHEDWREFSNGKKIDSSSENYPDEDGDYNTFSFDKSGTYIITYYYHDKADSSPREGTYSISGNTITFDFYMGISNTLEIKKLTESQLVLIKRNTYSEDYLSESIWTCKRIE